MSAPTWAMTGIVGCFVGGWLSDLMGRKTVIIISTFPFLIGLVVLGLAHDLPMVMVSRAIQVREHVGPLGW